MLSAHAFQDTDGLRPEYRRLPVDVIAEPVPSVRLSCALADLRRLLLGAAFLIILDRKRGVLGAISLDDELPLTGSGPKDWLSQRYQEQPEHFRISSLPYDATLQEAALLFAGSGAILIPLIDKKGKYTGRCASLAMLERLKQGELRPSRIGGLATPLGVYMTSGFYTSGAGWKGLLATGVLFGVLSRLMELFSLGLFTLLVMLYPPILLLPPGEQGILEGGLLVISVLALIRITPIAGLHAAEHMTINAMEQGLKLSEPLVRTQPREHQRCGTNLVVFLTGIQVMALSVYFALDRMSALGLLLYVSFWLWIVLTFWKPAGLWLQRYFTTKNPTSTQLASGIKAGQGLLDQFNARPHGTPGFWRRLWGAGFLQMLAAFIGTFWLMGQVLSLTGWR